MIVSIAIVLLVIALIVGNVETMRRLKEINQPLLECQAKCNQDATNCANYYSLLIKDEIIDKNISIQTTTDTTKKVTSPVVDASKALTGQN